jgi:hypothetical protein
VSLISHRFPSAYNLVLSINLQELNCMNMTLKMRGKITNCSQPNETINPFEYENLFYHTSDPSRLAKLIAHYELYKKIINLPGHVVECGVFKGTSFIRWCTFREILEVQNSRKIIGFDIFGNFPSSENFSKADLAFVKFFNENEGVGFNINVLDEILRYKKFINYELVKGDIIKTIPEYIENHQELRISLLHIDVDVYDPTISALGNLYDRVVSGGVIIFDDYNKVAGETNAVDEFLHSKKIQLRKISFSHTPSYIVKP